MWAVILSLGLTAAAGAPSWAADPCQTPLARDRPRDLYRDGAFVAAHHLASTLRVLCPGAQAAESWGLVEALALTALDDGSRASRVLRELATAGNGQGSRPVVALAWLYLRQGDDEAFVGVLRRLPPAAAARLRAFSEVDSAERFPTIARALGEPMASAAVGVQRELIVAGKSRRPWLAAVLSAIVPGAGQVYAGSWGAAAAVLAANALLIGTSVELYRRDLPLTAATAAVATSMVYLGGVLNAADLARRRNVTAARAPREQLERLLVPEVHP
jgi:hypothetical protein